MHDQNANQVRPWAVALAALLLPGVALAIDITVVDQHGAPLVHAVVTAQAKTPADAPAPTATIAQSMQQFLPRVTVVPVGARISFPNRDTTQHHVYSFSEAKQFELELYKGENPNPVTFDRAGIVALGCNIHDWMLGYVYVTPDPLFAASDTNGSLSLPVVQDEIESLTVWHPAARDTAPQTIPVTTLQGNNDRLRLVLETRADDPLAFELDPLQELFRGAAE